MTTRHGMAPSAPAPVESSGSAVVGQPGAEQVDHPVVEGLPAGVAPVDEAPSQVVVRGVTVRYDDAPALDGVDLVLPVGDQLAVVGPSGCGKSTLVRVIAGLVPIDAGVVEVAGRVVADEHTWVPPEDRGVGVVFQDHALFPHLDVRANVGFGLRRGSDHGDRVDEVLALVGLGHLAARYPHELSGGEQQRTALARALAPRPAVLLLDEPFSNLDRNLRERIRLETVALLRAERISAIFVTHDRDEALSVGSRVAVMRGGRIEQLATPETVYHAPANRFVARFLDHADFLPGRLEADGVHTAVGILPVDAVDGHGDRPAAATGAAVDVMVRPHEVVVSPDADGAGQVVATEFRGGTVAHVVRLDDATTVTGLRSHTAALPVGARVAVRIDCEHPLVAFAR